MLCLKLTFGDRMHKHDVTSEIYDIVGSFSNAPRNSTTTNLLTWCKAGDLLALWLLGELQFESNPLSPFFRSFFFFDRTMCASIHVRNFVPNMLHTRRLTERRPVENAQVDRGTLTIIVRGTGCDRVIRARVYSSAPFHDETGLLQVEATR